MTNEELVEQIQQGVNVKENMQLLYDQNSGLIWQLIKNFLRYDERDDLMQEAYFGLAKAVEKYTTEKGVKFITFAGFWIRNQVQRYCQNNSRLIRTPVHIYEQIAKYHKFCDEYQKQFGMDPDDSAICDGLGISMDRLTALKLAMRGEWHTDIDSPIPGTESLTIGDLVPDSYDLEDDVIESLEGSSEDVILQKLDILTERQKTVIQQRLEGKSFEDIAKETGVTRQAACDAEKHGLNRLRKDPELQQIAIDRGFFLDQAAWHGTLKKFEQTWTSSTEEAALKNYEHSMRKKQTFLSQIRKVLSDDWKISKQHLIEMAETGSMEKGDFWECLLEDLPYGEKNVIYSVCCLNEHPSECAGKCGISERYVYKLQKKGFERLADLTGKTKLEA